MSSTVSIAPTECSYIDFIVNDVALPLDLLPNITGMVTDPFLDPESYQSQALDWLCSEDGVPDPSLSDQRVAQRWVLACFYFATFNVSNAFTEDIFGNFTLPWGNSTNWLSSNSECTWARIGCNELEEVNIISMVSTKVSC